MRESRIGLRICCMFWTSPWGFPKMSWGVICSPCRKGSECVVLWPLLLEAKFRSWKFSVGAGGRRLHVDSDCGFGLVMWRNEDGICRVARLFLG